MCKVIAKTKGMDKGEWMRLRKKGIGGSDAGAVCGLNPYVSALDVFLDKTSSDIVDIDNEAMREGRDFEDYVAKRFMEESGLKVRRANMLYASSSHPFMLANVDRLIVGKEHGLIGLECKTASPYNAEKWKDGNIPAHYLAQCYHYMAVLDARAWYIAVLIYGKEFKYIRIDRNEEIIQNLIRLETDFWKNHVETGILPAPDGSDATDEFISSHFGHSREKLSMPLLGFDEKLKRREEITELLGKLETEKKRIEQEVKIYMQDAETAENERFLISWKNTTSSRIDSARLKAEMPEVYRKFCRTVPSRRFVVRAV